MKKLLLLTVAAMFMLPTVFAETYDLKNRTVELTETNDGFVRTVTIKNEKRRAKIIAKRQAEFNKNEGKRSAKKRAPKVTRTFEATDSGFKITVKGSDEKSIANVKKRLAKEKERLASKAGK